MAGENWDEACRQSDLQEGKLHLAKVGKRNVLLLKKNGSIFASGGKCPHYGAPLEEGMLINHVLTCPWHTARFDLTTGTAISPPAFDDLVRYVVKTKNGIVYIKRIKRPGEEIEVRAEKGTYVVVGGGAAGFAAAVTMRKEGFDGRVIVATSEVELPYDRPSLSKDFLAGEMEPKWVTLKDERFYKDLKIEFFSGHQVISVDPERKELLFASSSTLAYDKLLLATGGIPMTPDILGTDLPGFFLLRSFGDAQAILSFLERAQKVVIIGAGFIGLETAAALRHQGLEVHVVAPESVLMEKVFGERVGARIRKLHQERGVQFHLGVVPEEIRGQNDVRDVLLSDQTSVSADLVIAGIGIIPAVHFFEDIRVVENNAVPVDGMFRTKMPDIYAAGDIASIPDAITGGRRRVEHWVEAQRQGQHAARAMLGFKAEYHEVPFFWTKQYDHTLKYVGHSTGYDQIIYRGAVEEDEFIAGYFRHGKLEAAAAIGKNHDIIVLGELLRRGTTPSEEQLHKENFQLEELLS